MQIPRVSVPTIAIENSEASFPVLRIYCVGQNYADHALEMGSDPDKQEPFFFSKPADAVVPTGAEIPYPPLTEDLQYEVELVVALGAGGSNLDPQRATSIIFGYAVGVDLTRRDLQRAAKLANRPWDMAKGFDHSAPIGAIRQGCPPQEGEISLQVNGAVRQHGNLRQMIWSVPDIVAKLSTYVTLSGGDIIFTGTPSGVGPIQKDDRIVGRITGVGEINFSLC